jgi:hypothetical protein
MVDFRSSIDVAISVWNLVGFFFGAKAKMIWGEIFFAQINQA